MAIFASTTTSGYSDPLKAMSIKALEQRQKDLLAQQAAQPDATASMATIPGGIGHVLGQVGDAMQQRRADQALAAQKEALARTIAGMSDPSNPKPQELATIATADPESYRQMLTTLAESRRQQAGFTHDDTTQTNLFGHQDKAAAEAARVAQAAADAQEQRLGARPHSDIGNVKADVQSGKVTPEEGALAIKKLTEGSVGDKKYVTDMQEKSVAGQSLMASLDEALALTNHPKGIHAGPQAGNTQSIGENTPNFIRGIAGGVLPDKETTANTQRYNQIMGEQVMNLLAQMKGSSSDKDVQVNFKIANDPNATIDNKRKAIAALQAKIGGLMQVHNDALKEAGGKIPELPKPGGAAAAAAPAAGAPAAGGDANAAAKAWLEANPNDPRAEAVRKKLGGG